MLVAILFAVGLTLGGYCALLACQRPRAAAASSQLPATPEPLPLPQRLPGDPDFGRMALAASSGRPRERAPITLRVSGVAPAWRTETSGIALLPTDGSRGMCWLPLTGATATADRLVLQHELPRTGEIVVALASAREFALHAYLARQVVDVAGAATIDLDATAAHVDFRLPAESRRTGPFRLVRVDDPLWVPMDVASTGLTVAAGAANRVWLGRGSYELCDPLEPTRRQRFVIPANGPIGISASLAGARGDRP